MYVIVHVCAQTWEAFDILWTLDVVWMGHYKDQRARPCTNIVKGSFPDGTFWPNTVSATACPPYTPGIHTSRIDGGRSRNSSYAMTYWIERKCVSASSRRIACHLKAGEAEMAKAHPAIDHHHGRLHPRCASDRGKHGSRKFSLIRRKCN